MRYSSCKTILRRKGKESSANACSISGCLARNQHLSRGGRASPRDHYRLFTSRLDYSSPWKKYDLIVHRLGPAGPSAAESSRTNSASTRGWETWKSSACTALKTGNYSRARQFAKRPAPFGFYIKAFWR